MATTTIESQENRAMDDDGEKGGGRIPASDVDDDDDRKGKGTMSPLMKKTRTTKK